MSNKDPAFLFYSSDFLTGTMLMTDEQVGRYIRLMCLQHQAGHLSEKDMLQICKEKDDKIFSKFSVDKQGFYYNKRLDEEVSRRKEYSKSRKINGSKGGRPKKPYANHMESTCEAYENHTETENETENDTKNDLKKTTKKDTYSELENFSFSESVLEAIKDWIAYKEERKDGYKPTGFKTLLKGLKEKSELYGDKAVIDSIRASIESNYKGLFWTNAEKAKTSKTNSHYREDDLGDGWNDVL